uniref:Uncharacterized protein n=1 Tax=Rhizophora mucronata TaxID=61149 RepID=A0A2P2R4N0_RHIMU
MPKPVCCRSPNNGQCLTTKLSKTVQSRNKSIYMYPLENVGPVRAPLCSINNQLP